MVSEWDGGRREEVGEGQILVTLAKGGSVDFDEGKPLLLMREIAFFNLYFQNDINKNRSR